MKSTDLFIINTNGVDEVSPQNLSQTFRTRKLIDVRRPEEFVGELGHIPGSVLVTLGPELVQFLEKQDREETIIFVCRSGVRSREACLISKQLGFKTPINLQGGMIGWNELGLPIEK